MMTTDHPRAATATAWHSLHLALPLPTADTDAFLVEDLAQLMDRHISTEDWFFIRYGEGGPHLRIRFRAGTVEPEALAAELADLPVDGRGAVTAVPYRPETERYGGAGLLPIAEEVFTRSTRTALHALCALRSGGDRLTVALDLAHATAHGLGLAPLPAARWLRRHAASWRWVTEYRPLPGAAVHSNVNSVYAQQRSTLARRAATLRTTLDAGTAAPWLQDWSVRVSDAAARMRAADPERLGWVWASQLHMLFNRLGVGPDEERAVCRLAGRTLLETEPPFTFFPDDDPHAADLQYLERSKFQIGRGQDTELRQLPPAPAVPPRPDDLPLPADPLPPVTLAAALHARRSTRGALTGPLTAGALGGLLWHACAPTGTGRRPYPSGGALHSVHLRLLALDVDGLPAGTYHCLPETRSLRRIGPAPALDDLKALSSYLSRPLADPDAVGVDDAPAVLAVHLDLPRLRHRYGLRALRLGLLEAGHLAQNLLLTAPAYGLGSIPLGGLHDDLAHELLALDDLDQPIQYLLPLGRPAGEDS
ncbi:thiopeptide-type bacteriocin biosynthesis protein [Kitasatospora sp. NPDC088391]|uniref:thiopeptide-type bacteriocin biosynthesis protein n=1 Tax=Kitasatospora sp. NPDC088391 TaxID=3364074 RepID=UPI0038220D63